MVAFYRAILTRALAWKGDYEVHPLCVCVCMHLLSDCDFLSYVHCVLNSPKLAGGNCHGSESCTFVGMISFSYPTSSVGIE